MTAHIRSQDGTEQSLCEHLTNVSVLCKQYAQKLRLSRTAELLGLLHDMGKGTEAFADYLRNEVNSGEESVYHHNHAPTGAIYAYERWFHEEDDEKRRRAAQMLCLCIYGHHSGLMDCISENDDDKFRKLGQYDKKKIFYEQAVSYFLENVADESKLDRLFDDACEEIDRMLEKANKPKSFFCGMMTRLLLSILVDADRWDSACFEYGQNPFQEKKAVDWSVLLSKYENYAEQTFTDTDELSRIRRDISDKCLSEADGETGIYRLSVPTGGGKTFSSLRYALRHAEKNGLDRVFYVIPFNTILDQNAADIRTALDEYDGILEHHSNVLMEDEREYMKHKRLTERWDSDIILTSMVQFLNALFRKENTNARRMHRLTNSVIIFDEIQALPRKCRTLFERAVVFLTTHCHCTVVLCTATQMEFELLKKKNPIELMGSDDEVNELHRLLKRVEYLPEVGSNLTYTDASRKLAALVEEKRSALMIVNTKEAAWKIFEETRHLLEESGLDMVDLQEGMDAEEIRELAEHSEESEILCVHLSTFLCPAHRKEYIKWVQNWTKAGGRALCASTALIEAGINVSFPVVVRSLAGLPSIVQAAGRCNRNMEQPLGEVYLWSIIDENLTRLPEIAQGKGISAGMVRALHRRNQSYDFLSEPKGIQHYYKMEKKYSDEQKDYPISRKETVVSLLSDNIKRGQYDMHGLPLRQRFREAGEKFHVIPDETKPVLVPYGEGASLIEDLNGKHEMAEEISLLRKAQQYCVNLYEGTYRRLAEEDALYPVGNCGIVALKPQFYDKQNGVTTTSQELEEMIL